jgi:hypothetical protein
LSIVNGGDDNDNSSLFDIENRNDWIDHWDVNDDDDDESPNEERQSLERIIDHELVVELNVIVELNSFHV